MMNKLVKFTITLVVVLLVVSYAHAAPDALVARQETEGDGDGGKTSDLETTPAPKLPIPAAPSTTLDTYLASKTPAASLSASGSVPPYAPTGTGSLIPSWSALVAKGVPTGQPTSAPTPGKSAEAPTSAANKVESGLIGAVIAGFASLLF